MFATIISSWVFIALPGKSFKNDLQYLMVSSTIPLSVLFRPEISFPSSEKKLV
jgi:hypothetical protein